MGMIKARISDEMELELRKIIDEAQRDAIGGVEISLSSVVRYALNKYIEEVREREQGIVTLKFDLRKLSDESLDILKPIAKSISEYELTKGTDDLYKEVVFELIERMKK